MKKQFDILHVFCFSYIYNDMMNDYMNRPLYPNSDYPKSETEQNNNNSIFGNLSNLFSSQGGQNPLLSLLLSMKGANTEGLVNILGKSFGENPLFQAFSTINNNKKESNCSHKTLPSDEVIN